MALCMIIKGLFFSYLIFQHCWWTELWMYWLTWQVLNKSFPERGHVLQFPWSPDYHLNQKSQKNNYYYLQIVVNDKKLLAFFDSFIWMYIDWHNNYGCFNVCCCILLGKFFHSFFIFWLTWKLKNSYCWM